MTMLEVGYFVAGMLIGMVFVACLYVMQRNLK
jgi:hypothetical protein